MQKHYISVTNNSFCYTVVPLCETRGNTFYYVPDHSCHRSISIYEARIHWAFRVCFPPALSHFK